MTLRASADWEVFFYLVLVPLSFGVEEVFAHLLSEDGHGVVDLKHTCQKQTSQSGFRNELRV